jgi:hypothetical protein
MQHVWERWIIYTQFQPKNLKERGVVLFEGITLKYDDFIHCVEVYLAQDSVSREILW